LAFVAELEGDHGGGGSAGPAVHDFGADGGHLDVLPHDGHDFLGGFFVPKFGVKVLFVDQ